MVQIRPLKTKLGIEIEKYWERLEENLFFSFTERLMTAALFKSGFDMHRLGVTHAKSPFSEPRKKTLQDQDDLAPVFLGNRFAYKICIRDFRAIRSFNL